MLGFVAVVLLQNLTDVMVNDNPRDGILGWMTAAGIFGIGLVAAAGAGMMRRDATPGHRAMVGVWLMIGVTVVAMRVLVGEFTGEGVELVDVTSAVLMFLLYIVAERRTAMLAPVVLDPGNRSLTGRQALN